MDASDWMQSYRLLESPRLEPVLTGFNVTMDRNIPLTGDVLDHLLRGQPGLPGLPERVGQSLRTGSADELFVRDHTAFMRFGRRFNRSGILSVGGQAGIAAIHLAESGAPRVFCIAPCLGPRSVRTLAAAGVRVIGSPAKCGDFVHLVFEHSPEVLPFRISGSSRRSRFIVSPVHDAASVLLTEPLMEEAERASPEVRRLFLSGYQYLGSDNEFRTAAGQIRRIRNKNPDLRVHIEWVAEDTMSRVKRLIRFILPEADSIGLNERELDILFRYSGRAAGQPGSSEGRPREVIAKALSLATRTGLERVHIHTFGYYCLLRRSPPDPLASRDSLLFASREAIRSFAASQPYLAQEGLAALAASEELFGPSESPGIFPAGDFTLIMVPALIAPDLPRTIGMGDRISSAAFDSDRF